MGKIKKYIYPPMVSVGFLFSWEALVIIINTNFDDDGYGGLGLGLLILFAWLIIGLPIYCVRYSKIIVDEKLNVWFSAYNSALIAAAHILPFNLQGEMTILIIFALWVLLWNIVPLCCRLHFHKQEENENQGG